MYSNSTHDKPTLYSTQLIVIREGPGLDDKVVKTEGESLLLKYQESEKILLLQLFAVEVLWRELLEQHTVVDPRGTVSTEVNEQCLDFATCLLEGDV